MGDGGMGECEQPGRAMGWDDERGAESSGRGMVQDSGG